jgi:hypothetical protein
MLFVYVYWPCVQHDFHIGWCLCHLTLTQRVSRVEKELLTFPEHLSWVRTTVSTARYSDGPLFRRPIIPTAHYSDSPLQILYYNTMIWISHSIILFGKQSKKQILFLCTLNFFSRKYYFLWKTLLYTNTLLWHF